MTARARWASALGVVLLITPLAWIGSSCADTPVISEPDPFDRADHAPGHPFSKDADVPITVTFHDRVGDNIRGDGRGSYVDGECGVSALFNLDDVRLTTGGNIRRKDAAACGGTEPRAVMVSFTQRVDGSPPGPQEGNTVAADFFKVNSVELVTEADGTVLRSAIVHGAGCAFGLRFSSGLVPQSDFVTVTKNADGTWTVVTQPHPNDVAVCIPDEDQTNPPPRSYYHMPLSATVRLK